MEQKEEKKAKKGIKLIQITGKLLGFLALIFVIKKVLDMEIPWKELTSGKNIFWVLFLIIYQVGIMFAGSIPWKCYIQLLSKVKIPYRKIVDVYLKSNMLKYIPGNVFQYVGRNELALQMNISHASVGMATVLDVGTQFIVSMFFSVCMLGNVTLEYLRATSNLDLLLVVGIVGISGSILLYILAKWKGLVPKWGKITKHDMIIAASASGCYLMLQVLGSVQFLIILTNVLGNTVDEKQAIILMGAYAFSWVIGFITPGASGGIGVKEGIMLLLTGSMLGEGMIALAMVVSRIIGIAGDIFAYLLSRSIKWKITKNK